MNQRRTPQKLAADLLIELAGCVLFAVSVLCFTAPNHIAPGGVTGVATLVNYLWQLPIGTVTFLINLPLLAAGWKFLGRTFIQRTFVTLVMFSTVMDLATPLLPTYVGDPILAALFGGVCSGIGLALIFMRGSTTGGTDIACRLIQLRFPHLSVGKLFLIFDGIVLLLSAIVYQNIETLLYGMITIFTSSQVLDKTLYGIDSGRMLLVMSDHSREIADQIIARVGRGVTFLDGEGAYSGLERKVLLCAVRTPQYYRIKTIVNEIDPEAFLIAAEAGEILGYGFNPIGSKK